MGTAPCTSALRAGRQADRPGDPPLRRPAHRQGIDLDGLQVTVGTRVSPEVLFAVRGPEEHPSLVDADGLSYAEAAELPGIPGATVMSRLHRARTRVQLAAAGLVPKGRTR